MSRRRLAGEPPSFYDFVRAAACNQPLARQMLRSNPGWLAVTASTGETALTYVAIENDLEAARFLLDCGADVNARDHSERTPLMYAAQLGHRGMVTLLLQRRADVHARDVDGETALFMSARYGHAEICEELLQAGAEATGSNAGDETLLEVALPRKRTEIAAVLERHGLRDPRQEAA